MTASQQSSAYTGAIITMRTTQSCSCGWFHSLTCAAISSSVHGRQPSVEIEATHAMNDSGLSASSW